MSETPLSAALMALDAGEDFASSDVRAERLVRRIAEAFRENPNVLLVGPPGTGKTVAMEDFRRLFGRGSHSLKEGHSSEEEPREPKEFLPIPAGNPRVRSLVFHPAYTYEDFVVGLLPGLDETRQHVIVEPHVGPILELAHWASTEGNVALLEADEFNRGQAAAIFGDTLALLDRDKRSDPAKPGSGARIVTPYAHLGPEVDGEPLGPTISLPKTLYVLAAMNSADRSVAPLDAALRRRFSIVFVEPDLGVLREHLGVVDDFDLGVPSTWTTPAHAKALAVAILEKLNERIEVVLGRDFLLGQSVFWHVGGDTSDASFASLAAAIDAQVMGTLALTFVDNDVALAAVLNVDGEAESGTPAAARWHEPQGIATQIAARRLRLTRFADLDPEALRSALGSLL